MDNQPDGFIEGRFPKSDRSSLKWHALLNLRFHNAGFLLRAGCEHVLDFPYWRVGVFVQATNQIIEQPAVNLFQNNKQ